MRRVLLALLLTAAGLGLLLSFKSRSATASVPALAPLSSPSPSGTTSGATGSGARLSAKDGSYTGTAESTQFGNVQVQAVISGGKLTNVIVLQVPDRGGYEDQIVQIAVPELKSEALSAQSASIDAVSGATYTSQGYAASLQSALDQAAGR